jgi:class 3 adenylate cyclase/tetratricopeptide (TPR) repeat protein
MHCAKCGAGNATGKRFCGDCGAALVNRCARCGADSPAEKKFCGDCGSVLGTDVVAEGGKPSGAEADGGVRLALERQASEAIEGERKTVTALFADIKGSTELMRDLDPEEARAIIDPALKIMVDAVRRYDGYVVQSTGDGIFAVFGAPAAYEDHPQRALYAAVRMQEALREHAERLAAQGKPAPQARVGINTGEVVMRMVETGGRVEYTPVGHVTNLAARMQGAAPAGGIVISEDTRHLVEGYFELRDLGPTEVKGISEPINVYEVIGAGPLRGHFELAARRGLTKFVGREREVAELKRALELARNGHGQIVAAVAEAGTGKSRLVYEFKAMLPADCKVLEAYSVSHGKASPYLPVLELLYGYFGLVDADNKAQRRGKIEARLNALDPALNDTLPLLCTLMGLHEGPDPLAQMDPQIKRRRTLDAIKRVILRESLNQPTVVIFEDLHWVDSETQALLDLLADGVANARLLLLVNYRPEYSHAWTNKSYYVQLRLDALGRESAGEMLSTLLGDGVELDPVKRMVIERTEGNPFFIEEMVQALFDEGALVRNGTVKVTRALSQMRLPPTVQGILASRIDRLPTEQKELLQTLAVIGRESPFGLIRQVAPRSNIQLERMLGDLQAGEFVYEQSAGAGIGIEYTFKHALTQEVAYNSLLVARRKLLHERAGQALESMFTEQLDDHLGDLAHHYGRGESTRKAVHYLGRAGRQALERTAYPEALALLTQGLELLKELPDDVERALEELDLQNALGWLLYATKGGGAAVRETPVVRAKELCEQLGDKARLVEALVALSNFRFNRAERQAAQELAERALTLAERVEDPGVAAQAYFQLGQVLFWQGEFTAAREHCERALELFGSGPCRTFWEAENARYSSFYPVFVTALLGYPEMALKRSREGLDMARRSSDPVAIAMALQTDAITNWILRDTGKVLERTEEELALGTEFGMPLPMFFGTAFRAWALAAQGQPEEGVAKLQVMVKDAMAAGWEESIFWLSHLLAECHRTSGRFQEAIELAGEMLARNQKAGWEDGYMHLQLEQVLGDLMLMGDISTAAAPEIYFRHVIEVARRQDAKLFELRATNSLARLLSKQVRRDEARAMVADIYNWFTEGFDTADLKDAKALLDELNR